MTVEITIQVPDELGLELRQLQDRLPEVLARGLREVQAEAQPSSLDEQAIIEILTSQPTLAQILALRPSPAFQQRVSALLERKKQGSLTQPEAIELERALLLEHLVRMAKARALQHQHRAA
ncbi:hypothetical protein K2Z83_13455 [Oscillochloris sp. ZM17-4]|uniref:hypothetical protein n=1 Tax=Oscillochloris sp. ZM17-4 TaxID=2866714 RepID=UPI001C73AFD2|nr:hypothetical protein [Oscillochloris sp. ZM17-4]MBX0328683.1 hypothetical protein [Oscillochloris sp. ZM17-4]